MRGWGIILILLGLGSFIMPRFGMQFALVGMFGEYQTVAAIAMVVIGVGLVFATMRSTDKS